MRECDPESRRESVREIDDVLFLPPVYPVFAEERERDLRRDLLMPKVVDIDRVIASADPHVTVSPDGYASMSRAIHEVLTDAEAAYVRHLIEIHNTDSVRAFRQLHEHRPLPKAPEGSDSDSSRQELGGDGGQPGCIPEANLTFFWWGFRIFMNHCLVDEITTFGGLLNSGSSVVAAALTAALAAEKISSSIWVGLAATIVAGMLIWLKWADGHCGNMGANYNQSWTVQGWITTVC